MNNSYPVFSRISVTPYSGQTTSQNPLPKLALDEWEHLSPYFEEHGLEGGLRKILAFGDENGLPMGPYVLRFLADQLRHRCLSFQDVLQILCPSKTGHVGEPLLLTKILDQDIQSQQGRYVLDACKILFAEITEKERFAVIDFGFLRLNGDRQELFLKKMSEIALEKAISGFEELDAWQVEVCIKNNRIDRLQTQAVSVAGDNAQCAAKACLEAVCDHPDAVFVILLKNKAVYQQAVSMIDAEKIGAAREKNGMIKLANLIVEVDEVLKQSTLRHVERFVLDHFMVNDYPGEESLLERTILNGGNFPGWESVLEVDSEPKESIENFSGSILSELKQSSGIFLNVKCQTIFETSENKIEPVSKESDQISGEKLGMQSQTILKTPESKEINNVDARSRIEGERKIFHDLVDKWGFYRGIDEYLDGVGENAECGAIVVCHLLLESIKTKKLCAREAADLLGYSSSSLVSRDPVFHSTFGMQDRIRGSHVESIFGRIISCYKEDVTGQELFDVVSRLMDELGAHVRAVIFPTYWERSPLSKFLVMDLIRAENVNALALAGKLVTRYAEQLGKKDGQLLLDYDELLTDALWISARVEDSVLAMKSVVDMLKAFQMEPLTMINRLNTKDLSLIIQSTLDDPELEPVLTAYCDILLSIQNDPKQNLRREFRKNRNNSFEEMGLTQLVSKLSVLPTGCKSEADFKKTKPELAGLLDRTRKALMGEKP